MNGLLISSESWKLNAWFCSPIRLTTTSMAASPNMAAPGSCTSCYGNLYTAIPRTRVSGARNRTLTPRKQEKEGARFEKKWSRACSILSSITRRRRRTTSPACPRYRCTNTRGAISGSGTCWRCCRCISTASWFTSTLWYVGGAVVLCL